MDRRRFVEEFRRDLSFAAHKFARDRVWLAVAVATLALGIGVNSAVFSVVRTLVLNPLPYPHADRIVSLTIAQHGSDANLGLEPWLVKTWRSAHSFEDVTASGGIDVTLTDGDDPISIHGAQVDDHFFAFAGAPPIIGRPFVATDLAVSAPHVALLGEGLWHRRFGASRQIIGQTVKLDDQIFTIVGVAPARLGAADLWVPLLLDRSFGGLTMLARLRPGGSVRTAEAELETLRRRAAPRPDGERPFQAHIVTTAEMAMFKGPLVLLWGAVALLLVLTCANVAHLLLVRTAAREREVAIRIAFGASRGDLVRQMMTECGILAALGCAAGLGLGWALLRITIALRPSALGALSLAQIDGSVVWLAIGTSLATAVVFTVIGVSNLSSTAASLYQRTVAGNSVRRRAFQSGLVATEMAISAALLIGALLFVQSAINAQRVDPGFNTADLYAVELHSQLTRYPIRSDRWAYTDRVAEQIRALAGVKAVTVAQAIPPKSASHFGGFVLGDAPLPAQSFGVVVQMNSVRPDYFRVLGIPIRVGRAFDDQSAARLEAIVSETMARRLWPGRSPIGQRFSFNNAQAVHAISQWFTIVGVAGDVIGTAEDAFHQPVIYLPRGAGGGDSGREVVVVRAQHGTDLSTELRRAAARVDPLVVPVVATAEGLFVESTARQRFTIMILTIFAVLAVTLAAVGLYGVVAYVVAQRTHDIGVRIALGATGAHIGGDVLLQGLRLTIPGIVIGLAGSILEGRAIASMLYGVTATDIATYVMCATGLLVIAVLACLPPMWRALRVDPLVTLRAE